MTWRVSWRVVGGERGARAVAADEPVWQGETVRFTLWRPGSEPSGDAMGPAREPRNWEQSSRLKVIGADGRSVMVTHLPGEPLEFEYRFRWEGRKTLQFRGRARPAPRGPTMHTVTGEAVPLFPEVNVQAELTVRPEASRGGAAAETTGRAHRSVPEREGRIERGRDEASAARRADARAEAADRDEREARLASRGAYDLRPGRLSRQLLSPETLAAMSNDEVAEYGREVQAAIHLASPHCLDLTGRHWQSSADRERYEGVWDWRWVDGDVGFYFDARRLVHPVERVIDSEEAARVRRASQSVYGGDEWLLARFPGAERPALFQAADLATRITQSQVTGLLEAADYIETVFDILTFVGGGGPRMVLAGLRMAAELLLDAGRRTALGAARRGGALLGRAERWGATALERSRGTGALARGVPDDLPRAVGVPPPRTATPAPVQSATPPGAPDAPRHVGTADAPDSPTRGTGPAARAVDPPPTSTAIVPYMTGGATPRLWEMATSGLTSAQVNVLGRLMTGSFAQLPTPVFAALWQRARGMQATRIARLVGEWDAGIRTPRLMRQFRSAFGAVRQDFFRLVADDATARGYIRASGMTLPGDGRSPRMMMDTLQGRRAVTFDVDHISELGTHPTLAFSDSNLQFTFDRQNRIFHNLFHTMDPHLPDARLTHGRATTRAGHLRGPTLGSDPDAPSPTAPYDPRTDIDPEAIAGPWAHEVQ